MKDIKALWYPQITNLQGGPANVVLHLFDKLKKYITIYNYPSFSALNETKHFRNYAKRLVYIWANLGISFDIIHFLMSPTFVNGSLLLSLPAKVGGVPIVLNIHGIVYTEAKYIYGYISPTELIKNTISSISTKTATRIVVNSQFMFKKVVEAYGVNPEKVVVIPNGINVDHFQECNNNILLEGDPCILYVGRLAFVKGIPTLIKALAIVRQDLPNVKVHFVGDSRYTSPNLRSLIIKEGVEKNIVFHKWVSQSNLPSYYKSADFCVFPSTLESFGIVILEAMASGAPIIASDIPAFRELLSEGITGLFFHRENPQDLSKAILRLACDSNLKIRLSKNASEVVQTYDWEIIARKYLELYNSLL